jgi:hypothetical protein
VKAVRLVLLAMLCCWVPVLGGQEPAAVHPPTTPGIAITIGANERAMVTAHGVLAGDKIRDLLQSGFKARLLFHLELYKKNRWFDDLKGSVDWSVEVAFDPTARRYSVQRADQQPGKPGSFASLDDAIAAVEGGYLAGRIAQPERGTSYYYAARLEVRTLDRSDLDAVQGWLRGEAKPAIQGKRSPLTAAREGFETLVSRVIGGDRRTYEAQSTVFTAA